MQLLAQHGEIAVARRVQEADGVFGAAQADAIAAFEVDRHLTVKVHAAKNTRVMGRPDNTAAAAKSPHK